MYVEFRKMVGMNLFQSRNRDTDIHNKCMDTIRGKGGGMNWETGLTYTQHYV